MPRYIDADELRDEVDSTLNWNTNNEYNMYSDVMDMIDNAPTEDVQPVVHARWIPASIETEVYCSNCHGFVMYHPLFAKDKYCRFCGAKMDKE